MQLEELQRQWQQLDEKLDRTLKMESELLRLASTAPTRRRVRRLAFWPAFDVAFAAAILLFAGSFIADHWGTWSLVLPAVILDVVAILLLSNSVRQLMVIAEIDWDGPVAGMQSALSRLRILKIQQFKWVVLLAPLLWICGLVVGVQWVLDWQPQPMLLLDRLNPWWVAANYAFGLLFIPFGQAIIGFLAGRFGAQSWWQRTLDDISGSNLTSARAELGRWDSLAA